MRSSALFGIIWRQKPHGAAQRTDVAYESKDGSRVKLAIYLPRSLWEKAKRRHPFMKNNGIVQLALEAMLAT